MFSVIQYTDIQAQYLGSISAQKMKYLEQGFSTYINHGPHTVSQVLEVGCVKQNSKFKGNYRFSEIL